MFCTRCGDRLAEQAQFCSRCGAPATGPADTARLEPYDPSHPVAAAARPWSRRPVLVWVAAAAALVLAAAGGLVLATRAGGDHASPAAATLSHTPAPRTSRAASPTATTGPTPGDWATVYKNVADGVVRVETTACGSGGVGSGFLVAPDLVATVAHVVADADTVVLRDDGTTRTGTVIGFDAGREVALVRASSPFPGHVFSLASTEPEVGARVAAIGYPLAGPRSLSQGSVSGLGRDVTVEGTHLVGLVQTDTAINPGDSGGPLLSPDGSVAGLVEAKAAEGEGVGLAVPSSAAEPLLTAWRAHPRPGVGQARDCGAPTGPDEVAPDVTVDSTAPQARPIAHTFGAYATGINTGDYRSAYSTLTRRAQARTSYQSFADGVTTSYLFDIHVRGVSPDPGGGDAVAARVTFVSVQDSEHGHDGQVCSSWRLTYRMVRQGSTWLIDRADPDSGYPAPC